MRLVQVVPDSMVVLHDGELTVDGSYDLPLQPARPFWVMEYVSKSNKRKDYVDNMRRYERDLKVPYYLLFYPDNEELTLFRRGEKKYVSVKPNAHGRYEVAELQVEMGILDGWVRYWFRGTLLDMPAEMHRERLELRTQLLAARERVATLEDEVARLRAENNALRQRGA